MTNKIILNLLSLFFIVSFTTSIISCSEEDEAEIEGTYNQFSELCGKWQVTNDELFEKNKTDQSDRSWDQTTSTLVGTEIIFNPDSTGKWGINTIHFSYKSNKINLYFPQGATNQTWKIAKLNDTELTIERLESFNGKKQYQKLTCTKTGEAEQTELIVLGESTIRLTSEQIKHIARTITDSTLIFDSSLPTEGLPQIGQVLLNSEISEKFPNGFLGQVTNVYQQDNLYFVETECVPLYVAFKEFRTNFNIPLEPVNMKSKAIGEGKFEIKRPFEYTNEYGNISGETSLRFDLIGSIDIANKYLAITLQTTYRETMNCNVEVEFPHKKEILKKQLGPEIKFTSIPIGTSGIVVKPTAKLFFIVDAEGKISFSAESAIQRTFSSGFIYKDGISEGRTRPGISSENIYSTNGNLCFEGKLYTGISAALNLKPYGTDLAYIYLEPQISLVQQADIVMNFNTAPDPNLYSLYKDSKLSNYLGLSFTIGFDALFLKGPFENTPYDERLLTLGEYYLFPEFEYLDVDFNKNKMEAIITTSVRRNLLKNWPIGIGLFNSEGKNIGSSEIQNYKKEKEFPDPWQVVFSNLKVNSKYTVCPYIGFAGIGLNASPRTTFETQKNIVSPDIKIKQTVYDTDANEDEILEKFDDYMDIYLDTINRRPISFNNILIKYDTNYLTVESDHYDLEEGRIISCSTYFEDGNAQCSYQYSQNQLNTITANGSLTDGDFTEKSQLSWSNGNIDGIIYNCSVNGEKGYSESSEIEIISSDIKNSIAKNKIDLWALICDWCIDNYSGFQTDYFWRAFGQECINLPSNINYSGEKKFAYTFESEAIDIKYTIVYQSDQNKRVNYIGIYKTETINNQSNTRIACEYNLFYKN